MAERSRLRPAQIIVLALLLVPAWKLAERWLRQGPGPVSLASAAAGGELFNHRWKAKDPLTSGDGLGPVFNARSCTECHNQGGAGGGGPVARNVMLYRLVN